ncbi:MAG: antibiotic biosynthesis monooxygenase [Anaeroplasmataceae bacterium]|nr:antibiotic biosynthesis monooxygenase [Anaeroplasmataceae bacterium]
MPITINIYYHGKNGNAVKFAKEMVSLGIVEAIRKEKGNLRYDYFIPFDDQETVLLIDSWQDQAALDIHHSLPLMNQIAALREKYDLHMTVERFISDNTIPEQDKSFIRK